MKERPIIFSTQMVRAILRGAKTQTRRVIPVLPKRGYSLHQISGDKFCFRKAHKNGDATHSDIFRRPCDVGDLLWVRETFVGPIYDDIDDPCSDDDTDAIHRARTTPDRSQDILHVTVIGLFGLRIGCRKNAGMTGLKLTRVVMDVRKRKGREMDERKPHKWSEVIKAWADGKPIQCRIGTQNEWIDWDSDQLRQSNASALFFPFDVPRFDQFEWRVKPGNIIADKSRASKA